jgi:peptidoglycan/LPS O-acetylase OafA/YrhL
MKSDEHKLAWLQALRGVAALMVVFLHDRVALKAAGLDGAFDAMLPLGMGVDLFFLISGFIMVLTTRSFDGSPGYALRFLVKRFVRIWPIYAIVTVAYAAVEWYGVQGLHDPAVLTHALEGLLFIPHDPIHYPLYFQMTVGVAWTLCFEFGFYVVFAAAMLFGRYRYLALAVWFAITLVVVPAVQGTLDFSVTTPRVVHGLRHTVLALNPIVWDFVLGMLAGGIHVSSLWVRRRALIYGVTAGSLLLIVLGHHALGLMNSYGPRGWGLLMAIAFLGVVLSAKAKPFQVPAWMAWFGDVSYSLYLVHVLAFIGVTEAVTQYGLSGPVAGFVRFIVQPTLAILMAAAMYRYLEAPLSAWLRSALLPERTARRAPRLAERQAPEIPRY